MMCKILTKYRSLSDHFLKCKDIPEETNRWTYQVSLFLKVQSLKVRVTWLRQYVYLFIFSKMYELLRRHHRTRTILPATVTVGVLVWATHVVEAASSSFIRASYVGDIIARTDLHRRSVENLSHHFLVEANIICICIKQYHRVGSTSATS